MLFLFLFILSALGFYFEATEDQRYEDSCHPIYGPPDRDMIDDD